MALGVLNNLSAIYAENNLNNTNNSLQTVLQQLSSGSRINSGADDAAGLSLVNGLQANSKALTQSATNATEGVGLLQVADGALSQVTNLLNRAVTLATEASNGTLNTSQASAADQEYKSILAEISNIGSTTTYNQNQVFTGSAAGIAIYTGDSSAAGASVDVLYFANLSSASVGDAGGAITYTPAARRGACDDQLHTGRVGDKSGRSVRHRSDDHRKCADRAHGSQPGDHRCGCARRLHRRTDQHAERDQPGHEHAAGQHRIGAERHPGHGLCVGNFEHVEVRDSQPDGHRGARPGQQRAAGSDQAAAVTTCKISSVSFYRS